MKKRDSVNWNPVFLHSTSNEWQDVTVTSIGVNCTQITATECDFTAAIPSNPFLLTFNISLRVRAELGELVSAWVTVPWFQHYRNGKRTWHTSSVSSVHPTSPFLPLTLNIAPKQVDRTIRPVHWPGGWGQGVLICQARSPSWPTTCFCKSRVIGTQSYLFSSSPSPFPLPFSLLFRFFHARPLFYYWATSQPMPIYPGPLLERSADLCARGDGSMLAPLFTLLLWHN